MTCPDCGSTRLRSRLKRAMFSAYEIRRRSCWRLYSCRDCKACWIGGSARYGRVLWGNMADQRVAPALQTR